MLAPSLTPDRNCQRCRLHQQAQTVCLLGAGPISAEIMIIGQNPGAEEDKEGIPFIGNAGQQLNHLLTTSGILREDCFVTNSVACHSTDNKAPTPVQIKACSYWLKKQLDIVNPRYVLLLGGTALKAFSDLIAPSQLPSTGIKKARGRAIEANGRIILPTLHPAASFYDPDTAKYLYRDFARFKEI